jgi:hypothetical protein
MDTDRHTAPMTPDLSRRPAAVVAASILVAILSVGFAAFAIDAGPNAGGYPTVLVILVGWLIFASIGLTAVGVWLGNIAAQVVTAGFGLALIFGGISLMLHTSILARLAGVQDVGILALLTGAALVGLVLVPQSSRDWFLYEKVKATRG